MSGGRAKTLDLLERALELDPDARTAFLDGACAGHPQLRREVESLLANASAAETLRKHPAHAVASRLSDDRPHDALVPSTLLDGRYRVEALIGRGGMGEVYRARDLRLARDVAVKVLLSGVAADEDRLRRFELEARATGRLNHPNVVAIHDVGVHEGAPYVVSELLEGESLRRRVARGPIAPREAVELAIGVVRGLAAAHAKGIVHRDLKPDNVFVTGDGRAKVLDFGLAKFLSVPSSASEEESTLVGELTASGTVMGTMAYMSPEQLRAEQVDQRTDTFAFGAMFYEMLTGRAAFMRKTAPETMSAVLNEEPPPMADEVGGSLEALECVARRCLAKAPEDRYQTDEELESALGAALTHPERAASAPRAVPPRATWRWWTAGATVALAAAVGLPILVHDFRGPAPTSATAPLARSIAVLPFEPLVAGSGDAALELGMTDALINRLSSVKQVAVRPTSAVMRYVGERRDLRAAGAELGADVLLDGRIQRASDRIRVSVQLVQASDGATVWADTFDEKFTDIFAVQDAISRRVASALELRLSGDEQNGLVKRDTVSPEAYELYLKGRYSWEMWTKDSSKQAIAYYEEAIKKDPNYALAYAGLADVYMFGPGAGLPSKEEQRLGKEAATKALALDPQLGEAHAALVGVLLYGDWDFAGAERECKTAIELNPSYAEAHHSYSHLLLLLGRINESLAESKRFLELDPVSESPFGHLAYHYLYARQYDEAIQQYEEDIRRFPDAAHGEAHLKLGDAYAAKGMYGESVGNYLKGLSELGTEADKIAELRESFARSGIKGFYAKLLEQYKAQPQAEQDAIDIAELYARLGEKDQAFQWLERAYAMHADGLVHLKQEIGFDNLRTDPRYADLLRRVGLPQ